MGRIKDLVALGDLVRGKPNGHIPESPFLAKKYMLFKSLRGSVVDTEIKRRDEGTNKKSRIRETFSVIKDIFF